MIYGLLLVLMEAHNLEPWPIGLAVVIPLAVVPLAVQLVRQRRPVLASRLGLPSGQQRPPSSWLVAGYVVSLPGGAGIMFLIGPPDTRVAFKATWLLLAMLIYIPIYYAACRHKRYWP
ncbi:hypothetical protein GCM10022247_05870 [Allokutzneria multivorans]|uniref:Uncharacterized protein n=1 Tax=Allokutzneria multivorans TaxID=1142134 RepID=A0ABP7QZP1_9PSEU